MDGRNISYNFYFKRYFGARLEVVLGIFGPNRKMKTEVSKMKVGVSILDLERNDLEPPLTSNQIIVNYFFNLTSVADKQYFGARLEVVRGHFGPNRKMKTEV